MEAENVMSVAELKKALECPICFETRKAGPLYQCENGHILCSVCIDTVQECPQCRVKFPVTRIRNLFAEQQLERLPKQCKYSDNGCDFEQMPSRKQALNDHENECPHRNVVCFYNAMCNRNISISKLSSHLRDEHHIPLEITTNYDKSNLTIHARTFGYKHTCKSWQSTHFTLNGGEQFYSRCFRNATLGLFFLWVYMIGTPKEAENFTYTLTVYNNANKTESQSCKRNVISIDTPWKTICSEKSSMAGLILSDAVVKTFAGNMVDESFRLPYSISIESVKSVATKRKHPGD